jgi:hypothetical protein
MRVLSARERERERESARERERLGHAFAVKRRFYHVREGVESL